MEAIYIPQLLKAPQQTETIQIEELLSGLETLTPIRGRMMVTHCGNYLEISAQAETIITLTCDRCLQQYNHRLSINTSELVWLEEKVKQGNGNSGAREIPMEDLSESLPPSGYFQPDIWLYEQLCLATPLRKLCNQDCQGTTLVSSSSNEPLIDSRWSGLERLKRQLSQ